MNWFGAVAQLGERVNGIHEVRGSIPLGSTSLRTYLIAHGDSAPLIPPSRGGRYARRAKAPLRRDGGGSASHANGSASGRLEEREVGSAMKIILPRRSRLSDGGGLLATK